MKIAQIAPFEERVPPVKYGGTELIVYNTTEELVKNGHEVWLLASGDSTTSAKLIPTFKKAIRTTNEAQNLKARDALKFIGVGRVLEELKKLNPDIVHNHLGWRLLPFLGFINCPVITTLHGPLDNEYAKISYGNFKKANFVSISESQQKPMKYLNFVGNVYNGIELDKFEFSENPGSYLAFLGRISPEKGPVEAIMAAKKAGIKLKMAAKVDAVDVEFFETKVKPLIDGNQIEFIGEIGPEQKSDFLKNAIALLAPIQWEEPFGLFLTEAMACGTPVIAFDRGSVPEVIDDKKTGFIVKNIDEMVEAIKNIDKINRVDCRKRVEEYFTAKKMAENYEKVYSKILNKKSA